MSPHPRHPRLVGFAASIALLGLLIGLPAVLFALGWKAAPSSSLGWLTALTTPDDGHLTVLILEAVAWIVWVLLAASIITEVMAALRGRTPPHLPGLQWTQLPARRLVAAALLLFITVPALVAEQAPPGAAAVPGPSEAITAAAPPARSPHAPQAAEPSHATSPTSVALPTHTVRRGETLWSIAEHHLGSGLRYPEIAALNPTLLHGKPGFLRPGWVLTLPLDAADPTGATDAASSDNTHYTVRTGDTLSSIAERQLGDASAWHRIFEASRDRSQPDGRRLIDPNVILPGWKLRIPTAATSGAETATGETAQAVTPTSTTQPLRPSSNQAAPTEATTTDVSMTGSAAGIPPLVPAPTATTSSAGEDGSTVHSAGVRDHAVAEASRETPTAPWLLVGLSGAGALLAAGLLAALRKRRRAQFRARRPGRTIPTPAHELIPVEKTLITEGAAAFPTSESIDQALKVLARSGDDPTQAPSLDAVQLQPGEMVVQVAEAITLSDPWRPAGIDGRRWSISSDATLPESEGRAPYPLLVSVGQGDDGTTWLVNLEALGTVTVTGDPTYSADFARYVAAEIAVNTWSRQVRVDCLGIAGEAVALDPARIRYHAVGESGVLDDALLGTADMIDKCAEHRVVAAAGRGDDLGDDVWESRLVLADAAFADASLEQLLTLVDDHPASTGTAVLLLADKADTHGVAVQLTEQGRMQLPSLGLDLIAVGLTPDEAEGCALLLARADELDDIEMPTDGDDGWREHCDAAGALRSDLVLPREGSEVDRTATTVVPGPDREVLEVAAATVDDLQLLAPVVPEKVRTAVEDSDPDLDADLATWTAGTRPRLRLLGPIQARTGTTGEPTVVAKRKAFYAELLAFLALHPNGVSTDQLVDAFTTDAAQIRVHLSRLRIWLGIDPITGTPYLPEASKSPAALARGMRVYQLVGVLTDMDLFRRLRARGQARGTEGLPDLQSALALVTGEPFSGQRDGGWAWLADGVRVDQHMVCAIVDVAHLVTIAALTQGDLQSARAATEVALLAAPYEDTPRLDMAAVLAAQGDRDGAEHLLQRDVYNRTEDSEPPDDLPRRTSDLASGMPWLRKGRVA